MNNKICLYAAHHFGEANIPLIYGLLVILMVIVVISFVKE